jgi:guanine nucleotide-binding protein subunit alpha
LSKNYLGAGESGKSTVLKQMRLIHAAGFSASEKEAYRTVVFENVLTSMQAMLEAMDILRVEMHVQKNLVSASSFDWNPLLSTHTLSYCF